jgi:pyruvate kinase
MERHTKIVATLGPSTNTNETIEKLIRAGIDVVRMNFSHGTHADHAARYEQVRTLSRQIGRPLTILQDLQGPKIRTGEIQGGEIELTAGERLVLSTKALPGTQEMVSVDFPQLPDVLGAGSRVLLADGQMELVVTGVSEERVETEVVLGGSLSAHKGVNLPGVRLDVPCMTPKDYEDLAFGLGLGVDVVAMSFVRTVADLKRVRDAVARLAPNRVDTPIIAKLERPQALENLEELIDAADGVMVARGDLGVEMSPEAVPTAQKRIIEAANRHGKVVITATQMLESMMDNPRPTRAESSDVANAIFDGTDAVMLSGETAVGRYPVKTVETMNAIICEAESHLKQWGRWHGPSPAESSDDVFFLTLAAQDLAKDRDVAAIAVFTQSGRTARLMSKVRPMSNILAFTPEQATYQRLPLYWGVTPHLVEEVETLECMLERVERLLLAEAPALSGQQIVLICGFPVGGMRPPNLVLVHTVGQ